MMRAIRKTIHRWLEALDRKMNPYAPELLAREELTPHDYENLQHIMELPAWDTLLKVKNNRKDWHNKQAIAFCDGRSFVHFKQMEEDDELLNIVEGLVNEHVKKLEEKEIEEEDFTTKTISEYVP